MFIFTWTIPALIVLAVVNVKLKTDFLVFMKNSNCHECFGVLLKRGMENGTEREKKGTESTIIVRNVEKQLYHLFIRLDFYVDIVTNFYVALTDQMRSYSAS